MLSEEEKAIRWTQLTSNEGIVVESKVKGVTREEKGGLVSDLWLLVILLVVWISFLSIIEITG